MISDKYDPQQPIMPPEAGDIEAVERFFDASIEALLLERAVKVNEGNNGIVFRLNVEDISEAQREALRQKGIEFGTKDQAIKLLKVYIPGAGRREFELQKKAYDIVTKSEEKGVALVPCPLFQRELTIGEDTRSALEKFGLTTLIDRVEVLFMDFIPGEDIATIYLREALRRHPKARHLREEDIQNMKFDALHEEVARVLDYKLPGGKARADEEREFEREQVFVENSEKLYRFLERSGFMLHPTVKEQVDRSLILFHQNGLCFRDGHERNVMVVGDYSREATEPPEVFIIDFGGATNFTGSYQEAREALYVEEVGDGIKRYRSDEYLVNQLSRLSRSSNERLMEEVVAFGAEVHAGLKKLSRDKRWVKLYEIAKSHIESNPQKTLETALASSTNLPNDIERFIALVEKLLVDDLLTEEIVIAFIESRLTNDLSPFARNQLLKYNRYLKR